MNTESVSTIQTSDTQAISIETLLMKLAMAEAVALSVVDYATALDSTTDSNLIAPDPWAIAGMQQAFGDVAHALKSLCWGHADAYRH